MKFIATSMLGAALAIAFFCPAPARAQGSVTIHKGQLERVTWPKARPEYQIIDDSPIVKDLRSPYQAPQDIVIPIGPRPTAAVRTVGGGNVQIMPNTLAPAGFGQSNIPARGIGPTSSLPNATMGGLSPVDKARPIGGPAHAVQSQRAVAGNMVNKAPVAATYAPDHRQRENLLSGFSGGSSAVKTEVSGRIPGH